jgi:hypothetical protein
MRKMLLAATAAIALVCPRAALAQVQTVPYAGVGNTVQDGTLTTITTDSVRISLSGSSWGTVRFRVKSAGTATATAQYSNDGGTNWLSAPYAQRLSTANANPTVQAISATTLTTADVWEVPLPGNATDFRLLCGGTGSVTSVQLYAGRPYAPGTVVATLYDFTEANIGDGILTTTTAQDVAGWNSVSVYGTSPTGQSVGVRSLDDAGAALADTYTFTAASSGRLTLSRYGGNASAANNIGAVSNVTTALGARRIAWYLPAGGSVSKGRIIVTAAR